MKKTDALMWVMRVHEAIRKLPDNVDINNFDCTLYGMNCENRISIFLNNPIEVKNEVARNVTTYESGSKHITVSDSYGVNYWWAERADDD